MNIDKLILEKYNASDFEAYKTLVGNDAQMKYISGKGLRPEQAEAKFKSILEISALEEALGYFKVLSASGEYIGECKIVRSKQNSSVLEIGYLLRKAFWGRGIGSKICNMLLLRAGRFNPELDIIGIIHPDNRRPKEYWKRRVFSRILLVGRRGYPPKNLF